LSHTSDFVLRERGRHWNVDIISQRFRFVKPFFQKNKLF